MGCDKKISKGRCGCRPYVEVYYESKTCGSKGEPCPFGCLHHWSYLCFFHFVIDLIMTKVTRSICWECGTDGRGYCYVSNKTTLLGRLFDKLNNGELDET